MDAEDFELLAWEYFTHVYADGVRHAEVFFDPQSHTQRKVPFATILPGYSAACRRAEKEFGMSTKLIICFLRHLPALAATETFQEAIDCGDIERGEIAAVSLPTRAVC